MSFSDWMTCATDYNGILLFLPAVLLLISVFMVILAVKPKKPLGASECEEVLAVGARKKYTLVSVLFLLIITAVSVYFFVDYGEAMEYAKRSYTNHTHSLEYCLHYNAYGGYYVDCIVTRYSSALSYAWHIYGDAVCAEMCITTGAIFLVSLFLQSWLDRSRITVTDKCIYGAGAFGRRFTLPLDSVTLVEHGKCSVKVMTASKKFTCGRIKNADEICEKITSLLAQREEKAKTSENITVTDETDILKKYKELLDTGVISEEDFEAKKKQLLGL